MADTEGRSANSARGIALVVSLLAIALSAAPVSVRAVDSSSHDATVTICGPLTNYQAPRPNAPGVLAIEYVPGNDQPIAAGADITTETEAKLRALVASGSFTCIRLTRDGSTAWTGVTIAPEATFCGTVPQVSPPSAFVIDDYESGIGTIFAAEAAELVASDPELRALLIAFATTDVHGIPCVTFYTDATSGVVVRIVAHLPDAAMAGGRSPSPIQSLGLGLLVMTAGFELLRRHRGAAASPQ